MVVKKFPQWKPPGAPLLALIPAALRRDVNQKMRSHHASSTSHAPMASAVKKKLVVCGGNGFLGTLLNCHSYRLIRSSIQG